ncbi:LysM peptidoglycan-binding domain-containing protein [Aeromicrobium sp. SMF47]|uniref:LysM peptidoglycan-binding domain-containing protein n=1 Tax=Aeromicrobium TaxID=2040 RepID=UPI00129D9FE8|nr:MULTISPECIES: LysM domain-containing protein [Aeromicrobium]MRJ77020.1 LysM peptidoglycan-binding domain-containing protein [Aeromicrobium yanjiei]MRK01362.1 LysM peptidoglycan-binding domain-containing protein [Aeromicrobium sp. S22]
MSTITFSQFDARDMRPVRSVRSQQQPAAHVRLTRRGKAVILAATVVAIAVLAVMFGPSSTATSEAGTPGATTSVRVMSGHTLWEIAAEANPNGDIRKTVDDIIELNSLPNASALQMGSEIAVPVYDK